jgi:glycosyltransferase involved in cell wall biosynthesis
VLHSLVVGGAEVLAARLARSLGDDFRFIFACLDGVGPLGEQLAAEGLPVHVLGRKPGFDWRCARRLAAYTRAEAVDVVHAHQYGPFFYSLAARLLRRRPPILFTEHGRAFPDYPRRKRMLVNRLLLERCDRVVAVGEAVREALARNEGIAARRIEVVYNGIDLAPFRHPVDREAVRRELGVGPGEVLILQVARLDYLKDHPTAVRAAGLLARRHPQARLVLVGEGPEQANIEALIAAEDLGAVVRLAGLRRDVPRLLGAADVFLLTSISEGIPLTVIEAMAAGLPVVATDVGGMREVVQEAETGLLAPAGDPAALAALLGRVLDDQDLARQLGRCGQARARSVFGDDRMLAAYRDLYTAMCGARRTDSPACP